jgi:predicted ATPase
MLTRIQIDGFKSFEAFEIELSPFGLIVGANASGKSNLFDAIQFLSRLATSDLREASQGLRGEPDELFRRLSADRSTDRLRFAVEVLVDPMVRDPWGAEVELNHTRIRYELVLARQTGERGIERLVVIEESAVPIMAREDRWKPFGDSPSAAFKSHFMRYRRRTPWLETEEKAGRRVFYLRQDGTQGRVRATQAPEATVLSSVTTTEFPHLFALREELRSWRLLQLDPAALRRPSPILAPDVLQPDGSNLAAVLARIKAETASPQEPDGLLNELSAEVSSVIDGVLGVSVEEDRHTKEFRAMLRLRDGLEFPTRVISDGTLRVLALLTALTDPRHRGLLCFEEPENGVHPGRLRALIGRLSEVVADPTSEETYPDEPLSQLLMNSHSPVVLSALTAARPGQVFFADLVSITTGGGEVQRRTRIRPVVPTDQGSLEPPAADVVSRFEVERYLATVPQEAA